MEQKELVSALEEAKREIHLIRRVLQSESNFLKTAVFLIPTEVNYRLSFKKLLENTIVACEKLNELEDTLGAVISKEHLSDGKMNAVS
jgi:hypothetical protein